MRLAGIVSTKLVPLDEAGHKNAWKFAITPSDSLKAMSRPDGEPGVVANAWKAVAAAYPQFGDYPGLQDQWNCHAIGGSLSGAGPTYDLESFRGANPDWENRILPGLLSGDPGYACRW